MASLERVLASNPNHPGALHYWIHLWEPTETPERAESEADRLLPLMPGAGHIIHMPAHIYMRVGRYADAVKANQQAVAADEDYIAQCRAQGMYPLGYYPHNIHFIWMGATMSRAERAGDRRGAEGGRGDSARGARDSRRRCRAFSSCRTGRWCGSANGTRFSPRRHRRTIRSSRGACGTTRARWRWPAKGRLDEADTELAALEASSRIRRCQRAGPSSLNTPDAILRIAPEVLAGDIAARRKDWDTRAAPPRTRRPARGRADLHRAGRLAAPVRQALGAVLLEAGRADEAEAVYWDDLRRNPGTAGRSSACSRRSTRRGRKTMRRSSSSDSRPLEGRRHHVTASRIGS